MTRKTAFLSIMAIIASLVSASPSIRWCPYSYLDKRTVKTLTLKFFRAFNENRYHDIKEMSDETEMSYSGLLWMSAPKFLYFIGTIREKGEISFDNIRAYTFDDCETDGDIKKSAMAMYRVFDNRSILTISDIQFSGRKEKEYACLLFKKNETADNWYITAVSGFGMEIKVPESLRPGNREDWREEDIPQLRISLTLPAAFSELKRYEKILAYYMKGKTEKDAAIQVVAMKTKSSVTEEAYAYAEKILASRRHTPLRIKYLPRGYWLECEVLDRDKNENKIIITALRHKKHVILVSLIASMELYKEHWKKLEYSLENVEPY